MKTIFESFEQCGESGSYKEILFLCARQCTDIRLLAQRTHKAAREGTVPLCEGDLWNPRESPQVPAQWTHEAAHEGRFRQGPGILEFFCENCDLIQPSSGDQHLPLQFRQIHCDSGNRSRNFNGNNHPVSSKVTYAPRRWRWLWEGMNSRCVMPSQLNCLRNVLLRTGFIRPT